MTQDRPYIEDDLPPFEDWTWGPIFVLMRDLVPTQPLLVIDRLAHIFNGGIPRGGDMHPHVVHTGNKFYIHDGHHRWAAAWLSGQDGMHVRIFSSPK